MSHMATDDRPDWAAAVTWDFLALAHVTAGGDREGHPHGSRCDVPCNTL